MSRQVQEMFADIAPAYDRTNTVLSLGVHGAWRRKAVKMSGAQPGDRVLDVATGTGDLAFAFQRRVGPTGHVLGVDFTGPMLQVAQAKAARKAGQTTDAAGDTDVEAGPLPFVQGDAQHLPVPDDAYDVASIAFGIRNVDDPVQGIRDMARAVRPGGRVVVLEFGQPSGPVGVPYRWYSKHVMPAIGGMLTGNREAYEYLPATAAQFPCGADFEALMREAADFVRIRTQALTGGIAWLYVGTVAKAV